MFCFRPSRFRQTESMLISRLIHSFNDRQNNATTQRTCRRHIAHVRTCSMYINHIISDNFRWMFIVDIKLAMEYEIDVSWTERNPNLMFAAKILQQCTSRAPNMLYQEKLKAQYWNPIPEPFEAKTKHNIVYWVQVGCSQCPTTAKTIDSNSFPRNLGVRLTGFQ